MVVYWAPLVAQIVKNPPAMPETCVWSLGWENPLEEGMAPTPVFSKQKSCLCAIISCPLVKKKPFRAWHSTTNYSRDILQEFIQTREFWVTVIFWMQHLKNVINILNKEETITRTWICICPYSHKNHGIYTHTHTHTHTHNEELLSHRKEWNFAICNNTHGPGEYYS